MSLLLISPLTFSGEANAEYSSKISSQFLFEPSLNSSLKFSYMVSILTGSSEVKVISCLLFSGPSESRSFTCTLVSNFPSKFSFVLTNMLISTVICYKKIKSFFIIMKITGIVTIISAIIVSAIIFLKHKKTPFYLIIAFWEPK